jgi:hypothetical protein
MRQVTGMSAPGMRVKGGVNASSAAGTANLNAAAQEGREPLINTHQNVRPQPRNNRPTRSSASAVFVILTPLGQGVENRIKWARVGSIPFDYMSKRDKSNI